MGRTILVADDSPTIQKKASGILTGEGLDVVTVSNGVAAVKKLPTVKPLVVLADVSMPGKDGYEVCEHIKSNTSLSHISVILIFSDTDPYDEARGARVNADGRVKKPFDNRGELIATVSKFVAQSEAALAPKQAPPKPATPAAFDVEPVDEEQEMAAREKSPDFAAFSGGVAFGVPSIEEIPSVPADATPAEPMPAEPIPSVEEPAAPAEGTVEEMAAIAPAVADESPSLVMAEQADVIPSSAPAPEVVEPMLVEEEAAPEATSEDAEEHTMLFRAPADIAQPILSDEGEVAAPVPEPAVAEAPAPAEEPPAAEPVESAAEPAPPEAPFVEQAEDVTPAEGTPIPPQTLESYTLNEAAAGHVRFASPETEVHPEPMAAAPQPEVAEHDVEPPAVAAESTQPEAEAPPPEPAPPPAEVAPPAKTVDEAQVFSIVHKVVLKMSPPALSPLMIEDIARRFADEIVAELKSES